MAEDSLHSDYPWLAADKPIVVAAPMMKITMARLAIATSSAGGFGYLAAGYDLSNLSSDLAEATSLAKGTGLQLHDGMLPIGVGFQNWGSDLQLALNAIKEYPVAAVWFFAAKQLGDLVPWAEKIREATANKTKVWVQIGTVAEAVEVAKSVKPDVIVVQGADSGGHGLAQRASLITLLPEVADALAEAGVHVPLIAAGGIVDGRNTAAALTLGAHGVALGTRFLACEEASIMKGYQNEVLRVGDGGSSTVSSKVYDVVRGIKGWPSAYNGRGVANQTYRDAVHGMDDAENEAKYKEEMKKGDAGWGENGRMTTYVGTGVGLVKRIMSAADIVSSVQDEALKCLEAGSRRYIGSRSS